MSSSSSSSSLPPFVCLPMYGEHKRAISSVKLASSRLTNNRPHAALCASSSADGSVKIWDLGASSINNSTSFNSNGAHNAMESSGINNNHTNAVSAGGSTSTTLNSSNQKSNNNDNATMTDDEAQSTTTTTTPAPNTTAGAPNLLHPTTTLVGHSRGINDVAWSKSGDPFVATASDDKTLRLWDAQTGDALVEFRGHDNFVFCTQFNGPSNLLVSGSFDETVKLWDVRSGECVSTLPAHSDPVTAVSFNRDGTCVVSASHDGLIRIWDVSTGECLKTIFAAGNPPVSHVVYSPNGKYVLAGTLDSKLRLWPMTVSGKSKCAKTYSNPGYHVNTKYCIVSAFLVPTSRQRQSIVTGSETGHVILYDIQSRKVQQVLEKVHTDVVLAVDAHDKKELLASGGMTQDKTVRFWAPQNEAMKTTNNTIAEEEDDDDDDDDDDDSETESAPATKKTKY